MSSSLISTENLTVEYAVGERVVRAVADVTLKIEPGEIVGVVGESGSGKSTLCAALIRALPPYARISGKVAFAGNPLYDLSVSQLRTLRRRDIAMVPQNPMTSLDPLFTIGNQMEEVINTRIIAESRGAARLSAVELLSGVHITAPEMRIRQYPHELSGGMKQRVLIAIANASSPKLLLADEPTSALDATIQEGILVLFDEIREKTGSAVVIVSHDLGAIKRVSDRTIIMYAGRVVEDGSTKEVFSNPKHPYTRALLASLPAVVDDRVVISSIGGQVPDLSRLGPGCAFAERCADVTEKCDRLQPPLRPSITSHSAACWNIETSAGDNHVR
jgi:oligopeptide/dipeptide ABC transporter ATP-binding protein